MYLMGPMMILLTLAAAAAALAQPAVHLGEIRQLTFGGQNAESYWSPDGRRLIFQSTRDGLQCDQIFIMNADGSNPRMVSTGKGRTTCAYFLKDGKHIVYASTHEADPACPPPPDRSKGYVWVLYSTFDNYLATDEGKIIKKLTETPGYDAEATVNFKTGRIVYTSMASGDPELWIMNPDGSGKRQITRSVGYDGGAVLSRDGKKIVWRAKHQTTPEEIAKYQELLKKDLFWPMKMELFLADADGRNVRQVTNFGCASFAPTFTPDGRKILFASNKHACDSHNFELYLVNLDGSGLEQVTHFGGFTSFPEFSPDGKRLAFTSSFQAKGRYEFNIFVGEWR